MKLFVKLKNNSLLKLVFTILIVFFITTTLRAQKFNPYKDKILLMGKIATSRSEKELSNQYEPLLKYLSEKAGVQYIGLKVYPNLNSLLIDIDNGVIDIAWLTHLSSVELKSNKKIEYICKPVRNGKDHTNGVIVTNDDSGIKDIKDLNGKSFVWVDKESCGNYLFPKALMFENGFNTDFFSKETVLTSPDGVIDNVLSRKYDAGAFDINSSLKNPDNLFKLSILAKTQNIPNEAIAVSNRLDEELKRRIMGSFLSLNSRYYDAKDVILKDIPEAEGFVSIKPNEYNSIEKVLKIIRSGPIKPCYGIGGFRLGDIYDKKSEKDENTEEKDFKPVYCFDKGCLISRTPKTHKIYRIELFGPKGEYENSTRFFAGRVMSFQDGFKHNKLVEEAVEFIEKFYNLKSQKYHFVGDGVASIKFYYWKLKFPDNNVEITIGDRRGDTSVLLCESKKLIEQNKKEVEQLEKDREIAKLNAEQQAKQKRFNNADISGLDFDAKPQTNIIKNEEKKVRDSSKIINDNDKPKEDKQESFIYKLFNFIRIIFFMFSLLILLLIGSFIIYIKYFYKKNRTEELESNNCETPKEETSNENNDTQPSNNE